MQEDDIIKHYDTESIALNIDENIANSQQLKRMDNSYSVELHATQPDRIYRGPIIAIQDDLVIQELSPGVAIGHSADKLKDITKADIGKDFTISYDKNGSMSIAQELSRDRGNEIDR